jgi:hypothetical protein
MRNHRYVSDYTMPTIGREWLTVKLHLYANRESGTIEMIENNGRLRLKVDTGRAIELDPRKHPYLDHSCAMTSHSSRG